MEEMTPFVKNIIIGLVDKEIKELENHEFTFHCEHEISTIKARRTTPFDWYTHGVFYNSFYTHEIVSEEEARFNREVLNPMEIRDARDVYERLEILKEIKKLLEEKKVCLEEL